jgi:hypothetical protein
VAQLREENAEHAAAALGADPMLWQFANELTVSVGCDGQQRSNAQMPLKKILENRLKARVSDASEQNCKCKHPETLCFDVEHDVLLVKAVSSFELAVPARAAVAHRPCPA